MPVNPAQACPDNVYLWGGRGAPPRGVLLPAAGCPRSLRQQVRREMLAESKKHKAWPLLCQIPSIGPIRAAVLIGILQTPHRFRTKRQLWTFSGLGVETRSSADHRYVEGQLERSKKPASIRGLNENTITI